MNLYLKLIMAVAGATLLTIQAAVSDNVVDPTEKVLIASAFFGALLVFVVANPTLPFWVYTKGIAEVGVAVTAFLTAEWANGAAELTTAQWWGMGIMALTALGVIAVPGPQVKVNSPPS